MAHDSERTARTAMGEVLRDAADRSSTPDAPPVGEIWQAGARRRSARRTRWRIIAVAAVVLVVASVPAVVGIGADRLEDDSTVLLTDEPVPQTRPTDSTRSSVATAPSDATAPTPTTAAPAPTSTAPSDVAAAAPSTTAPAPTTAPTQTTAPAPPSTVPARRGPADLLIEAGRAEFGDRYGGISASDGVLTLYVVPGPAQLPATFRGHPVAAAEHSWAELEAWHARVAGSFEELRANGIDLTGYGITGAPPLVRVYVAHLDDAVRAAVTDFLGEGPWRLEEMSQAVPAGPGASMG